MSKSSLVIGAVVVVGIIFGLGYLVFQNDTANIVVNARHTQGPDSAQVKVEEFSDFQCPACKAAQPILKQLAEKYKNQVQFSYRYFPLVTIHQLSFPTAVAAECAGTQNKFWEYHEVLFNNQPQFQPVDLENYAQSVGLNLDQFKTCQANSDTQAVVRGDMALGLEKGVDSTPTYFVNGEKVLGAGDLEAAIQKALTTAK